MLGPHSAPVLAEYAMRSRKVVRQRYNVASSRRASRRTIRCILPHTAACKPRTAQHSTTCHSISAVAEEEGCLPPLCAHCLRNAPDTSRYCSTLAPAAHSWRSAKAAQTPSGVATIGQRRPSSAHSAALSAVSCCTRRRNSPIVEKGAGKMLEKERPPCDGGGLTGGGMGRERRCRAE